jgi:DNA-binding MarR family transcriptional regulator
MRRQTKEGKSYLVPVRSGVLKPPHPKQIGPALWTFLWCLNRTTTEEKQGKETVGVVLYGKPLDAADIAKEMGLSRDSVLRHLHRLEKHHYLDLTRRSKGYIIHVRKSKKWQQKVIEQKRNSRKSDNAKAQITGSRSRARQAGSDNAKVQLSDDAKVPPRYGKSATHAIKVLIEQAVTKDLQSLVTTQTNGAALGARADGLLSTKQETQLRKTNPDRYREYKVLLAKMREEAGHAR